MINNPTLIVGTANQILANGTSGVMKTGLVTLTLPQSIGTGSSPTFTNLTLSGLTPDSFIYPSTGGLLTSTTAATNGQLLIGSTGAAPVKAALTAGTGISVTNAAGSITLANTGVVSIAGGTTGLTPASATTGVVTLAGVLVAANGGTNQSTYATGDILYASAANTLSKLPIGTTGQVLTIAAGIPAWSSGATGVTSVGLALPSIFSVSGSPVTSTGTLTGTLTTQAANTFFVGPLSGAAATPTFRTVGIDELSDVVITAPATNQVVSYNGTNWVNTSIIGTNASGNIGVVPSGGGTAWTLISGSRYYADFVHNIGTTNLTVTVWDISDNSIVIPQSVVTTSNTTLRITVTGNTKTLKVVALANGSAIATAGSVITAYNGTTVSAAAFKLNFIGATVAVTDAGSGQTDITVTASGTTFQRYTYFANSLDTPSNADFAINALAPVTTDPTYTSMNIRSFSNTAETGVACMCSIPTGATSVTVKIKGRAQTAPGVASVVQPRLYYRNIPNNAAVAAWSAAQELANISIPTNANFQYSSQTITLATLGLTAGNLYQFEFTRRLTGVTGTNLASFFYMSELTLEFA
jgi:hypothetical protein